MLEVVASRIWLTIICVALLGHHKYQAALRLLISKGVIVQKIATRVFIVASLVFGVSGILVVLTSSEIDASNSDLNKLLMKLLIITVFIILPSFALSVASKYL